ncbi:ABC transporter substrate-binding protein [Kineosporia babensis]|uniref:ABC transporter substrate-binding protein n=1 Tax=Kineosporia babensis TaxID=499548 RepID=A0A9X1NFE7_9ACTN|nr:ABC transporter substrate-binding protein [Kineosporia babensis]MCD5312306.1 ABC transporter substrate-binding protein [Kineosporia babensis]
MFRPIIGAAVTVLLVSGCSSASTQQEGATRAVDTFLGEVKVPEKIDSVVILDGRRDQDIVLSLGLPLTGGPQQDPAAGYELPSPMAEARQAAAPEELFLENEVNLEALAAAAPDLIVCHEDDLGEIREQLQAIAPVLVVAASPEQTWQDDLLMVGAATGTSAKAEQLIADYDARVAEVKENYADEIAATKVSPISWSVGEGTGVRGARLHSRVLLDVGAQPADGFAKALETPDDSVRFSPEQTLEAHQDADALLVSATSAEEWRSATEDPLFGQLPAVRAERVVRTDRLTFEGGPITAMHTLGLVEQLYGG